MASIARRPDGRWRARYRDTEGREHARHFDRKVDAQRFLDNVTASVVRGDYVDPARSRMTLGEWAAPWIAGRAHLKPKTLSSYRSLLRTRVLPRWEDVPLRAITHADAVAWVAGMRSAGLSASRTRQAYHLLTSMLDDAVKDNRLPRNPIAGVDLPRLPTAERRYLTHSQVEELAEAAGRYRLLVLVLAYSGLRWGEAVALRVGRVVIDRGRLEVVEAIAEVDGRLIVGEPKSYQRRSVPVPRFLRDEIAVHIAGKAPGDLVFTSPRGETLRVHGFRRTYFDPAAATVGLAGLVPHELRHTAASLAITAGASIKGVQEMLGHASATLTLDRYGHLFGDELDAVAERLELHRADFLRTRRTSGVLVRRPTPSREPLTSGFAVPPAGFEPATHGLGNRCSIP
jgi:integrase